ncbi:MAG: hypothetical protein LBK71_10515 [Verrucomicrobiales bacterium]|jgi:membrane-bound serine protease (ClpP class)|nr:hypothetical protein [Verrucomicrobiales bacterium]
MTLMVSLIIAALLLFTAEIFLPGLIAGALGAACLVGSIIAASHTYGASAGLLLLLAEVVAGIALFMTWMKYFPASPLGKKFSLRRPAPQTSAPAAFGNLLHRAGVTISPLRPAGVARIDGQRRDVVSEGLPLPVNTKIKVVKVEGARIVVRKI